MRFAFVLMAGQAEEVLHRSVRHARPPLATRGPDKGGSTSDLRFQLAGVAYTPVGSKSNS
jgi:hypothetical protein